jgi:predicted acetyltransferase
VKVRRAERGEVLAGLAPVSHYFGSTPTEEGAQRFARVLDHERMHVAEVNGVVVGGASAFDFRLTVPGAIVPAAGVTIVGVLPTHRRRGILTALMRAQLDDVRERGEPLAVLWASEETIYGRYGYGMAAQCGEIELQRVYGGFRDPVEPGGTYRLLSLEDALDLIPPVYERVAAETPGMFSRSREWWESRVFHDPEARRDGGGEMQRVVYEREGEPLGYALYRLKMEFEDGSSVGETRAIEAMGVDPNATAAIWRFLIDVDWMDRVHSWLLPVDHPLFFLLERPRRLRFRLGDSLWVRLVDVGAALTARERDGVGDVAIEVVDSFCPWNNGVYGADGSVASGAPDLRLDVSDLGSVYLGGFTFGQLRRAGRIEELSDGAAETADGLFRTERAPWCPEIF